MSRCYTPYKHLLQNHVRDMGSIFFSVSDCRARLAALKKTQLRQLHCSCLVDPLRGVSHIRDDLFNAIVVQHKFHEDICILCMLE